MNSFKNSSVRIESSPNILEMPLKIVKSSDAGSKHASNVSNVICHGDLVVSGSDDGRVKVWKSGLELASEMDSPGGILSLAACDNLLYSCSSDGMIRSWDLATAKNLASLPTTLHEPQKLFLDSDTKILWAGDGQGNVARFEDGKETGKFELVEEIWDLAVANNLVYTARDRDVAVAEIVQGSGKTRVVVKATLPGRSPICISGNDLCFLSRDGRSILVHGNDIGKKFPKSGEIPASDLIVNALASPPGSGTLFSGGYDCTVKMWDLKRGSACSGSVDLGCCINALACSPEKAVFAARSDGVVTKVAAD